MNLRKTKSFIYGTIVIVLFLVSCENYYLFEPTNVEYGILTDISGNTYKTVRIGEQFWMAENLKTDKLNNGEALVMGDDWSWYDGDSSMNTLFGKNYNWLVVNTGKLCPSGWRVPSVEDWNILIDFLGDNAGGKLKTVGTLESGTGFWQSPNSGATNETGFSALPGYSKNNNYGQYSRFWTIDETSDVRPTAFFFYLSNNNNRISKSKSQIVAKLNVRCIKN